MLLNPTLHIRKMASRPLFRYPYRHHHRTRRSPHWKLQRPLQEGPSWTKHRLASLLTPPKSHSRWSFNILIRAWMGPCCLLRQGFVNHAGVLLADEVGPTGSSNLGTEIAPLAEVKPKRTHLKFIGDEPIHGPPLESNGKICWQEVTPKLMTVLAEKYPISQVARARGISPSPLFKFTQKYGISIGMGKWTTKTAEHEGSCWRRQFLHHSPWS